MAMRKVAPDTEIDEAVSIIAAVVSGAEPSSYMDAAKAFLVRHGASGKPQPVVTIERLLDKSKKANMTMTPVQAARSVLPGNLMQIPRAELRDLAAEGLRARISRKQSYRNRGKDEAAAVLVERMVDKAVEKFDGKAREYARILASVSFAYDGQNYNGLTLPIEGSEHYISYLDSNIDTNQRQLAFHKERVARLRKAGVKRADDLSSEDIIDIGIRMEAAWKRH